MSLRGLTFDLGRFFDVRPGEIKRIGFMAALLFFLLAANNIIKVVRDSLFLSRFPITQLPYVYLLAAVVAGLVIGIYSRYTSKLSLPGIILGSLAFIISNVIIFWLLVVYHDAAWVLYAYYLWSAIAGLVLVAQFWTFANDLFTARDGKRLFGIIAAGGTVGAMVGGVVSHWAVGVLFGTNQLLGFVVALLSGALAVAYFALRERERLAATNYRELGTVKQDEDRDASGVIGTLMSSRYLQTIAAVVFVSVVVSTLIDYQFKATAKLAYPSADDLAGFFGAYYAWLSVVTMAAQLWLTGKLLIGLGLTPSLLVLPIALLAGSFSFLAWPSLLAATATRMTEASLRTSVNQSSVQILYLPIADAVKKKVKVFLDVTVERIGDGVAAVIILSYTFLQSGSEVSVLGYFSIGLVFLWIALVFAAKAGYVDALRRSLAYRELALDSARLDFTDKATIEILLKNLDRGDEQSVLLGLDLLQDLDPKSLVPRLPRGLLRHPSAEVRRRALMLFARSPEPDILAEVLDLLASDGARVQAEAINTISTILKKDAVLVIGSFLHSQEPQVRRAAIQGLLQYGDAEMRRSALSALRQLIAERGVDGEKYRVEAARLMGELEEPSLSSQLRALITDDPAPAVVREAMAAAARRGYPEAIPIVISRLCCGATKTAAREALVQYGEMAIRGLRNALFDSRVSPDIRLNIPRTLSKIDAQPAMNALLGGLLDEDRSLRFQVILAIEEMARHFATLKVDREIVESAIMSDALLYSRRFAAYVALFGTAVKSSDHGESLLYFALTDSMERVKERVMWLLSLINPAKDIRRAWAGLNSEDPTQRAHAIEFLDNLLIGSIKKYVFALYSDGRPDQRLRTALDLLGTDSLDTDSALRALLDQDDAWLKAAAIWEIGGRKLGGFRESIAKFINSDNALLRETASVVTTRI